MEEDQDMGQSSYARQWLEVVSNHMGRYGILKNRIKIESQEIDFIH